MDSLNSDVDLSILEAYLPIPELVNVSEHMFEYLAWF